VRALMHVVDVDDGQEGTTVSVQYRLGGGLATRQGPPVTHGPPVVEVERIDGVPVARLHGEIDRSNAERVAPQLLVLAPGPVVVDLSGLGFLGSAGLQVLFGLAQQAGRLAVVAPVDAPYRRAIEVAELGRVALIADTLEAALEHLLRP